MTHFALSHLLASISYTFIPVLIAGLTHSFPSRTRPLRTPAAMVLQVRLRESSTAPEFFYPEVGAGLASR